MPEDNNYESNLENYQPMETLGNGQQEGDEDALLAKIKSMASDLRSKVKDKFDGERDTWVARLKWGKGNQAKKNQITLTASPGRQCFFQLKVGGKIFSVGGMSTSTRHDMIDTGFSIFKGDSYNRSDRLTG